MKKKIKVLKALGDETRLRIACILAASGELCVCEIMAAVNMKQSAISKALRVLKEAEIINDERRAQWMYYSINTKTDQTGYEIIKSVLRESKGNAVMESDLKNLKKYRASACKGE